MNPIFFIDPTTGIKQEIILPNKQPGTMEISWGAVAHTDNKLWLIGYYLDTRQNVLAEWNLSGPPPYTITYNQFFELPYYEIVQREFNSQALCAIDDNTIIFTPFVENTEYSEIHELKISTGSFIDKYKYTIPQQASDIIYTTSGKLLAYGLATPRNYTEVINQYIYSTGALEFSFELTYTNEGACVGLGGLGIYNGEIYYSGLACVNSPFYSMLKVQNTSPYTITQTYTGQQLDVVDLSQPPRCSTTSFVVGPIPPPPLTQGETIFLKINKY
jgi:hypothetical protein